MIDETNRLKKWKWPITILVAVIVYILLEKWPDLKEGYIEAYRNQTGTPP
jgi:hypothetical protein